MQISRKVVLLTAAVAIPISVAFAASKSIDANSIAQTGDQIDTALRKARLMALEIQRPMLFSIAGDCHLSVTDSKGQPFITTSGVSIGKSCSISNQSQTITFMPDGHVVSDGKQINAPLSVLVSGTETKKQVKIEINPMGLAVKS